MNILVLSHYFEPYNLVGAKRMSSLVRFLAASAHKLTVLKADNEFYEDNFDEEVMPIENVIIRDVKIKRGFTSWIKWIRAYKKAIDELAGSNNYDLAIFCGGPFNYFILGPYIKRKYGIRYVLDFRDVAAHRSIAPGAKLYNTKVKRLLMFLKDYAIEALSIRKAERIVTTTEQMENFYRKRFPRHGERMITIYNGYDDVQLRSFEKKFVDTDYLSVGIFGKFSYYGTSHLEMLKEALEEITEDGIQVKVIQIGNREANVEKELASFNFVHYSTMPYCEGMSILSSCRVLLTSNYLLEAVSTKVFDYIYLNRPVIAFVPEDSASQAILSQFEHAYFPQNSAELKLTLRQIYEQKIMILSDDVADITKYSRKSQNERYRRMLEELI